MLRRVVAVLVVAVLVAAGSVATSASTAATPATAGPTSTSVITSIAVAEAPVVLVSTERMLSMALVVLVLLGLGTGVAWYAGVLPGSREQADDTAPEEPTSVDGLDADTVEPETAEKTQQELLSDEDRVLQLLEEHGGRMKQVHIVEQTDWSKSKVSMLLSDMEEDGEISKLRVGRENIISLAGEEPEAAGSPFEEE